MRCHNSISVLSNNISVNKYPLIAVGECLGAPVSQIQIFSNLFLCTNYKLHRRAVAFLAKKSCNGAKRGMLAYRRNCRFRDFMYRILSEKCLKKRILVNIR